MDPIELGKRLKEARENRGLRQEDAAEVISAPRTAIAQIEAGNRSVSTHELSRLAELYARPITQFFVEHAPSEEDVLVALFRLDPLLTSSKEVRDEVERAVGIYQEGAALERLLEIEPRGNPPSYELPFPQNAIGAVRQGNDIAEAERERLGLGKAPIGDIAEIISAQGVWASGIELPNDMSGFFLSHPSIGMAIGVNSTHARARKRFSFAHEYAHALLDRASHVTVSKKENSNDLMEKRANAFAAAFLMPKSGVEAQLSFFQKGLPSRLEQPVYSVADDSRGEALGRPASPQDLTYQDVAFIAQHFGVSYQATVYRLRSLDRITKQECDALFAGGLEDLGRSYIELLDSDCSKKNEEEKEENRPHRELVKQVYYLAVEAYRREAVSRGRLFEIAKKLGTDPKELLRYAEAAKESC